MSFAEADRRAQLDERLRAALDSSAAPAPPQRASTELLRFSLSPGRGPLGRPILLIKRVLRRLLREVFGRQTLFNRAVDAQVRELHAEVAAAEQHTELYAHALRDSERRIAALEKGAAAAREHAATHGRSIDQLSTYAATARARLEQLDGESGEDAGFEYLGFTDRFRGDEALIAQRQRRYVARFAGQRDVVDIGCGRGEFLDLMREQGIRSVGVDLEGTMVQHCRDKGLEAVHADALAYLEEQGEASLGGVYAAQVIEHLQPSRVVRLLELCRTRLRPGGVVVLETINPQSLITFASFYLDPTHVKPVHPLALEWLACALGFDPVEIEYTSEVDQDRLLPPLPAPATRESEAFDAAIAHVNALLYGPQEYAVIARKP